MHFKEDDVLIFSFSMTNAILASLDVFGFSGSGWPAFVKGMFLSGLVSVFLFCIFRFAINKQQKGLFIFGYLLLLLVFMYCGGTNAIYRVLGAAAGIGIVLACRALYASFPLWCRL